MARSQDIDEYLERLPEAQRLALQELRQTIAALVPDAEEGMSYGVPAFRLGGRPLAGFSAARAHLSYAPMSGAVVQQLGEQLAPWGTSKGTVRFTPDHPLTREVVAALLAARIAELEGP